MLGIRPYVRYRVPTIILQSLSDSFSHCSIIHLSPSPTVYLSWDISPVCLLSSTPCLRLYFIRTHFSARWNSRERSVTVTAAQYSPTDLLLEEHINLDSRPRRSNLHRPGLIYPTQNHIVGTPSSKTTSPLFIQITIIHPP
jgi:hypothetical protein